MRMLDKEELTLRWGELAPKVDKALEHGCGETSSFDLFLECLSGNAQCWEDGDLVAITRFNHFNQYKQLQVVTTTGTDWFTNGRDCLTQLEHFAKGTGCRNVSIWGRKAWKRILTDYEEPYTVLIKEV